MPRYDSDDDDRDEDDDTRQQAATYDDDDDDEENNVHQQNSRAVANDDDDDDDEAGQNKEDEDADEDGDADDGGDADEDAEPEDIPDEGDEDPVDLEGHAASQVTEEEKKEIGMMVAKQLIAQLFNHHNPDPKSHVTQEHVHAEEVDNEDPEEEDKTLIRLTTADARGHATSVEAKLDTGAGDNLMSADICEVLGLPHENFEGPEGPPTFTVGSGQQISPLALAHLHYKIGGKAYSQGFHVMETLPHDLILGGPFLLHSHLVTINLPKATKSTDFLLFDLDPKAKKKDISAFKQQRQAERGAAAQARTLKATVPPKQALPVRKR